MENNNERFQKAWLIIRDLAGHAYDRENVVKENDKYVNEEQEIYGRCKMALEVLNNLDDLQLKNYISRWLEQDRPPVEGL